MLTNVGEAELIGIARGAADPPSTFSIERGSLILRGSTNRSRNFREICRMCATCFIDEQIKVARHSHFGWRMILKPRQNCFAAFIAGSSGNDAQISVS